MPFLHSDTLSVITGELALATPGELEEGCVGLSIVSVLIIASHQPLIFPKCIAVLWSICNSSNIPDIVADCPFASGLNL